MSQTNEETAKDLAEAFDQGPEDWRAAAIVYALLALGDEVRNLAAEVEKAGWAKKE